jgi:hypothetical protein
MTIKTVGKFHCLFCGGWCAPGACAPPICRECLEYNKKASVNAFIHHSELNWKLRNKRIQKTGNVFGEKKREANNGR